MEYKCDKQFGRHLRLENYDYSESGAYFITICTKNRECIFGEVKDGIVELSPFGKIAQEFWFEIPERFNRVQLDKLAVMPNHIHVILMVGAIHELPLPHSILLLRKERRKMLISKIIGFYKMNTAKKINRLRNTEGVSVYQRNYYDRIIRNDDELNRVREYIIMNPLKWEFDKENPVGEPDEFEKEFWEKFR